MGFRARKNELDQWRRRHAYPLTNAGLPDGVAQNHNRFCFTLQEGWDPDWAGGTGWTLEWLDDDQARTLHDLLLEGIKDPGGWDLITRLQRRLCIFRNGEGELP